MNEPWNTLEAYSPSPELQAKLDTATPTPRDFVLYCPRCNWVGETNAAYAAGFIAEHKMRIWKHTP